MSSLLRSSALVAVLTFAFATCVTNPETGRSSFQPIPSSLMNSLGAQSYQQVLQTERLSTDARTKAIVDRVAARIIAVVVANPGDEFQWEVSLVESPEANAFVLPGGKIVVYTGLLPIAENEAGLAFIMGHEVGHAIAGHGNERMSSSLLVQGGLAVADITFQDNSQRSLIMGALGTGAQYGLVLPYSRLHESEADNMGLRYMARAGYDPQVAPGLWERMGGGQAQPPEFGSTHPSHERRAQDLRDQMPDALKLYQAAAQKHGLGESFGR